MQKHVSRALYDLPSRLNTFLGSCVTGPVLNSCCSKNIFCIKYVPFLTCARHSGEIGNSGPTVYSHIKMWRARYMKQAHVQMSHLYWKGSGNACYSMIVKVHSEVLC